MDKRSCPALISGARRVRGVDLLLAVVEIKGELCLPLVVQRSLTEGHQRYSRLPPCSGIPAGWTRRGSVQTLRQPPRCGTVGASGTEEHENKSQSKHA